MFKHKVNFEKILKEFNKTHSLVPISLEDIKSLPDEVLNSDVNRNYVYGIQNSAIYLAAIDKNLDNYCPLKENDLICKSLFFGHSHNKPVDYTTIGSTFYFKTYFSKDMLYVYELDYYARVLSVDIIKTSDILSIGNIDTHMLLKCYYNNSKFDNTFLFVKRGTNDTTLYDAIIANGLPTERIEKPSAVSNFLMKIDKIG